MDKIAQEFYEKGYIDKEAAERLSEFSEMIKQSNWLKTIGEIGKETLKKQAPTLIAGGIGAAGGHYLTQKYHKELAEQDLAELQASFGTMATKDKDIAENESRARARFNEVAHFSPTLAKMPNIAGPLVKRTMDSGLSERDVKNLVQIEAGQAQRNAARSQMKPMSARLFEQHVPGMIGQAYQQTSERLNQPEIQSEMSMKPASPQDTKMLLGLLINRGAMPPELSDVTMSTLFHPETAQRIQEYSQKNPAFIKEQVIEHDLVEEWNEIVDDMDKHSSANFDMESISLEKRAEILADQYCLIKESKMGLQNALFGLGAATLFGAGGALAEQVVDFKRTEKANQSIRESWDETKKRLKKMNEEDNVLSSGIDYGDKENITQAERAFGVLSDVAPTLASNPTVATPFVNRVVQQGGDITPDIIKMISETQRNINTSKQYRSPFADSPLASGFGRGFDTAGGKEFIKGIASS